jgi:5'-deoxynucleotidase YfbR-like HD superfamily hydrolase
MIDIKAVYDSGFVQRYAQNPKMAWAGQTLGHHQWGVAVLLLALFPDEANLALVWEALHHDAGEMGSADVSYPAKRKHKALATAVADAEGEERFQMGVPEAVLTERETAMLNLCDRLESLLFASVRTPWVLSGEGWVMSRDDVFAMAVDLGVADAVERLLTEAGV